MRRNYHRKLLASIYQHAKNVGIIGILAYPKSQSAKERTVTSPSLLEGNCLHNVGKSLGEGLAGAKIP